MKSFHFETSLEEWQLLRNCWKIIEKTVKSDSKLDNVINTLNRKLFNNNDNIIDSNNNDISIESMNDLLTEIDNEMKMNEINSNNDNDNDNEHDTALPLNELYLSKVIDMIKKPVL